MQRFFEFARAYPSAESAPAAEITVYEKGTLTLASIFGDNNGTPKANPFTSDALSGFFFFYGDGRYDVKIDPVIGTTYTLGDVLLQDLESEQVSVMQSPFNAVGDDVVDDTQAIRDAYTAAKAMRVPLYFPAPPVAYKITDTLTFDGLVPVIGALYALSTGAGVTIKHYGANTGILLTGSEHEFRNFVIRGAAGNTGAGLVVDAQNATLRVSNITIINSGADGLWVKKGTGHLYENILIITPAGHGLRVEDTTIGTFAIANTFNQIDVRGAGGDGFHLKQGPGDSYANRFNGTTSDSNTGWSYYVDTFKNVFTSAYSESSTAGDFRLDVNSLANFVVLTNNSTGATAVSDGGWLNVVFDISTGQSFMENLAPAAPPTNIAGRDLVIAGSASGLGATGHAGGNLTLNGGRARGTSGSANGGNVNISGGPLVNGGSNGGVYLQPLIDGPVVACGSSFSSTNAALDVQKGIGAEARAFIVPRMSEAERDAMSNTINGMIIYNEDTNRFDFRRGGVWTNVP